MLRNLSDLGPRIKKRVTYSTRDTLAAITLDNKRPSLADIPPHQKPSIVNEEDEGQQALSCVAVDDVKSSTSDTSPSTDVNSQSDLRCLQKLTYADGMPHYVMPAQQSDFDTNAQLFSLSTYTAKLM